MNYYLQQLFWLQLAWTLFLANFAFAIIVFRLFAVTLSEVKVKPNGN